MEYGLRSLKIRESICGGDHFLVATPYTMIGLIYYAQGKCEKAVEYYSKALEIYKSVYGEDHVHGTTVQDQISKIKSGEPYI